jgi:hypothetical protein
VSFRPILTWFDGQEMKAGRHGLAESRKAFPAFAARMEERLERNR